MGPDTLAFLLDNRFPRAWQLSLIQWMCELPEHFEDPEEGFEVFLDDWPAQNEDQLRWVLQTWEYISRSSASTQVMLRQQALHERE